MVAENIRVTKRQPLHMKANAQSLLMALVLAFVVVTQAAGDNDSIDGWLDPVVRFDPAAYTAGWLTADRDGDGRVDYAVQVDERGRKLREAMDFNLDGLMDDFYFYSNDVLQRQEVDSNFDQAIDIWIYMWRGVYVRKWERDTDHDGLVDIIRDYDQSR